MIGQSIRPARVVSFLKKIAADVGQTNPRHKAVWEGITRRERRAPIKTDWMPSDPKQARQWDRVVIQKEHAQAKAKRDEEIARRKAAKAAKDKKQAGGAGAGVKAPEAGGGGVKGNGGDPKADKAAIGPKPAQPNLHQGGREPKAMPMDDVKAFRNRKKKGALGGIPDIGKIPRSLRPQKEPGKAERSFRSAIRSRMGAGAFLESMTPGIAPPSARGNELNKSRFRR